MSKVIVKGGTRSSTQKTLCEDCVRGQVTKGMSEEQQIVYCHAMEQEMDFNVEECNKFERFGAQSLYDMKQIATIIDINVNGIGFYRPGKAPQRVLDNILPKEYEDD